MYVPGSMYVCMYVVNSCPWSIWAQSVASVVQVYPCNNVHNARCRYIVCTFFFENCCTEIRAKDIRVRPLACTVKEKNK